MVVVPTAVVLAVPTVWLQIELAAVALPTRDVAVAGVVFAPIVVEQVESTACAQIFLVALVVVLERYFLAADVEPPTVVVSAASIVLPEN